MENSRGFHVRNSGSNFCKGGECYGEDKDLYEKRGELSWEFYLSKERADSVGEMCRDDAIMAGDWRPLY